MVKTNKEGVYTRLGKGDTTTFYITYRADGKAIKTKLGTDIDGWTVTKAYKERQKRQSNPIPVKDKNTLTDIADGYLKSIEGKSYHVVCKSRWEIYIKEALGDRFIGDISHTDISILEATIKTTVSPRTKKLLAPKTVNDIINLIHTIYRWHDKDAKSPCRSSIDARKPLNNSRLRYLSKEEYNSLLWYIDNRKGFTTMNNTRDEVTAYAKIFVKLAITTGARLGSVSTIRVKDIDLDRGTIDIVNHKSGGRVYKSFIHPSLVEELTAIKKKHKGNMYVVGEKDIPICRHSIAKALQPVLDKMFNEGVDSRRERVVIHTLRHTFGSWLAINGTPLYTIMKLLDHTSIEQTMVYAKLAPDSGKDFVSGLVL